LENVGGSGETFTAEITPPANQQGGQYRLRIRMTYSSTPEPCGSSSYGEVEDYTVFIGESLSANFNADVTEICEGLEVNFADNSSGDVDTWSWEFEGGTPATSTQENPTVSYAVSGSYDVTLTVTGEDGSNSMTMEDYITVMAMPETAGTIDGNDETCQGYEENYSVDAIANAQSYTWVIDPAEAGDLTINNNELTLAISDTYTGAATLKVCGGNSCGDGGWSEIFNLTVNTCVGFGEYSDDLNLSIYPNPASTVLNINLTGISESVEFTLLNYQGSQVYNQKIGQLNGFVSHQLNIDEYASGIYYLRLKSNDETIIRKVVIK
jgi:PKD repeat protein